jgi:hypothetical protein
MKKVERINTIMRYINNRAHFTISEIMREFNISRSTAIRDIRGIEATGMPLVAEVGRDGGYFVMHNSVLPDVRFTDNDNPDLLDLSDLPHPMLEKLIQIILLDSYLLITIKEEKVIKSYPIYLLHLYHEKSLWLIEGFDLKEEKKQIFPVDHLTNVEPYPTEKRLSKKKILEKLSKQEEVINLVFELGPKAIAQFKKYHPLKVSISYTNPYQTTAILKTFINVNNPEELTEITNWLLFLGGDIKVREVPEEVLEGLQERLCLYYP